MTPQQCLLRTHRTFAEARVVLAEDYNYFAQLQAAIPPKVKRRKRRGK
jgi:hypothetical protein